MTQPSAPSGKEPSSGVAPQDVAGLVTGITSFAYSGFLTPSKKDLLKYAATLTSQAGEIERLKGIAREHFASALNSDADNAALQSQITTLREALEPFVALFESGIEWLTDQPDEMLVFRLGDFTVRLRDFYKARTALSETNSKEGMGADH